MLAIVCHDAGGAEIISSWLLRQTESYFLVLDGPAKAVFRKKFDDIVVETLEHAVAKSDWVLTGTSWQSDLEISAIILAKKLGKKSVSFLDHWVNYPNRFISYDATYYPDEIWVGDESALVIDNQNLPGVDVKLKTNPYFEDLKLQINALNESNNGKKNIEPYILYVCSPVKEHAKLKYGDERYWGFTEEDAIRYFMRNMHYLNSSTQRVVLRPHPSEKTDKYNWAVKEYYPAVEVGGMKTLLEEIVDADMVVGLNSMAMVVGWIAGKRVVNAIPPGKVVNTLPMKKIEQLDGLIERLN